MVTDQIFWKKDKISNNTWILTEGFSLLVFSRIMPNWRVGTVFSSAFFFPLGGVQQSSPSSEEKISGLLPDTEISTAALGFSFSVGN